jgi:hypothetical protein
MSQMSYLFENNFEVAGRYAVAEPDEELYNNPDAPLLSEKGIANYELGVSKYLNGHRLKVQGGIMYSELTDLRTNSYSDGFWSLTFQMELGF